MLQHVFFCRRTLCVVDPFPGPVPHLQCFVLCIIIYIINIIIYILFIIQFVKTVLGNSTVTCETIALFIFFFNKILCCVCYKLLKSSKEYCMSRVWNNLCLLYTSRCVEETGVGIQNREVQYCRSGAAIVAELGGQFTHDVLRNKGGLLAPYPR